MRSIIVCGLCFIYLVNDVTGLFQVNLPDSLLTKNLKQSSALKQNRDSCDPNLLTTCVAHYAADLGLSTIPSDARQFIDMMTRLQNTDFLRFCMANKVLHVCLGDAADDCFSPDSLQALGLDPVNAAIYHTVYLQFQYECGAGFPIILKNYNCINYVKTDFESQLTECGETFLANVTNDVANICQYAQVFVDCLATPFKEECNEETGAEVCQLDILGLDALNCQLKCDEMVASNSKPNSVWTKRKGIKRAHHKK